MSRFRDDSELSRLNRDGRIAAASPDLVRVVELALEAREATGGLFDPTVHDAVVAAGYDRTFDAVRPGRDRDSRATSRTAAAAASASTGSTIELEPGTRLDLGGIGKGYAVDRVAELLAVVGPCLVNAGGDLAVRGGAWPVGVTDELTLELTRGGIATSGRDRRRWLRGGEERHHLIDPSTGRPADRRAAPGHRRRRLGGGGRGRRQGRLPRRAASTCRTCSSPPTGRTVLAGGLA